MFTASSYHGPGILYLYNRFNVLHDLSMKGGITLREYHKTPMPSAFCLEKIITLFSIDSFSQYASAYGTKGESHDFPEFQYVKQGRRELTLDGTPCTLEEGQLVIIAPNCFHYGPNVCDASLGIGSFEIRADHIDALYNRVMTLNAGQRRLITAVIEDGNAIFRNVQRNGGFVGKAPGRAAADYELQVIKNKLELLLIELYQTYAEASQPVNNRENYHAQQFQQLTEYLEAHIQEALSLNQFSADVGMSVSKIKRLFQENCQLAPMAYFNSLKIEEAKRLIRVSSLNFSQIAEHLGFDSVHYFSRFFKRHTALTPSEYARQVSRSQN